MSEPTIDPTPAVVLVHGAFAESSSWNGVITDLTARGIDTLAVANPLRSLAGDAEYVNDVIAGLGRPVLLVGHSYGGLVITEAASTNPAVVGLVYVCAFAPDHRENAFDLSTRFPGSTLGEALISRPLSGGGAEFAIRNDLFGEQFCADVPDEVAALMAVTQRPVTQQALTDGLRATAPAWRSLPSWFVVAGEDRNIPAALQRFEAERAGARGVRELPSASHAAAVSHPAEVARTVAEALQQCRVAATV